MEPLSNSPEEQSVPQEDESIFDENRLAKLKAKANEQYVEMCEIIKKSEAAMKGIVEWLKAADKNEHTFHTASKGYIETLKLIETENTKTKF